MQNGVLYFFLSFFVCISWYNNYNNYRQPKPTLFASHDDKAELPTCLFYSALTNAQMQNKSIFNLISWKIMRLTSVEGSVNERIIQ